MELYSAGTGNGMRAVIALEESGIDYRLHRLNLRAGEQRDPTYLKLNPTGRIPTLVDPQAAGGSALVLTQSSAIMLYVAEKSGRLLPGAYPERASALEWFAFFFTDVIAPFNLAAFMRMRATNDVVNGIDWLNQRGRDYLAFADDRLRQHRYFAGETFSIADAAAFPIIHSLENEILGPLTHVCRWRNQVATRDSILKAIA